MREILFRGKRKDNGEWVYGGSLLQFTPDDSCYIAPSSEMVYTAEDDAGNIIRLASTIAVVIPETVGQFTGLLDQNGTKIFEDDIVKDMTVYLIHLDCEKRGLEAEGTAEKYRHHGAVGVVQYNAEGDVGSCGCCFTQFVGAGFMAANIALPRCEVIGNIYDNPEVMEKTKCSV